MPGSTRTLSTQVPAVARAAATSATVTTRVTQQAAQARGVPAANTTTLRVITRQAVARVYATGLTFNPDAYTAAGQPVAATVTLDGNAATLPLDGDAATTPMAGAAETIGDDLMKTGDLEPPWRVRVTDTVKQANLAGVVSWRMVGVHDGTVVFDDDSPLVQIDPDGTGDLWVADVSHRWQHPQTLLDMGGQQKVRLHADVVAYWPGDPLRPQTFDGARYVTLDIHAALP
jgi:hypothetical protein